MAAEKKEPTPVELARERLDAGDLAGAVRYLLEDREGSSSKSSGAKSGSKG